LELSADVKIVLPQGKPKKFSNSNFSTPIFKVEVQQGQKLPQAVFGGRAFPGTVIHL